MIEKPVTDASWLARIAAIIPARPPWKTSLIVARSRALSREAAVSVSGRRSHTSTALSSASPAAK